MSLLTKVFAFSLTAIVLIQAGYTAEDDRYAFRFISEHERLQTPASFFYESVGSLEAGLNGLDGLRREDSFVSRSIPSSSDEGDLKDSSYLADLKILPRQKYPEPYPSTFRLLAHLGFQTFVKIPGVQESFILTQHFIRLIQLGLSKIDCSLDRITQAYS
jgi:hypothetical protein